MTTFSQLVDDMVQEHLRPDLRVNITAYANQTIRELHGARNSGAPILFASNREEDEWVVPSVPALWTIPSVARFQRLEAVYLEEYGVYIKERKPDRVYQENFGVEDRYYWYRTGGQIAIGDRKRESIEGLTLKFSYFMFPKNLLYYATADRPATWSPETEAFTYLQAYDVSDATRLDAQEKTTNWILLRWGEMVVKQGVRAKVFARLGEERAKIAYSAFESLREQMNASEQWQQNTA